MNLTSDELVNGKMDTDSDTIYMAFDVVSLDKIFIVLLNQSDGSIIGSAKQRDVSKQPRIGSVDATSSSTVYISLYSLNESYSEFIKYDSSSGEYKIYEQTGIKFRFQYINTALSDCWIGLVNTQYTHLSQLSTMAEVTNLSLNILTNDGLTNVSITPTIISTTGQSFTSMGYVTTPNNYAEDFNVEVLVVPEVESNTTTNNTNTNSDDDSLSTLAIILISIGSVTALVIIAGVIFCVIRANQKRSTRKREMSRVENPVDEENSLREENKI